MANSDDPSSMVGILTISMSEILQASSRKHKQLRDSAQFVTDELKSNSNATTADAFFLPLKLACEVKVGKVMEIALDCIQKLIAYGYLRGSGPIDRTQFPLDTVGKTDGADSTSSNPNSRQSPRKLIDLIIETVYDCSTFQDDGVQLQVIKVLLTAVTGTTCEVHEHSLMLAIRACYHIHLSSRNQINRTTAKASLTQMLNTIFQNMEVSTAEVEKLEGRMRKDSDITGHASQSESSANVAVEDVGALEESNAAIIAETVVSNLIVSAISQAKAPKGKFGWCTVCNGTAQHYCLQTKVPVCSIECKKIHLEKLGEGSSMALPSIPASGCVTSETLVITQARATVLQNDAFLLFRALCKLSVKQLSESENDDYPIALRSKTLSLELLLSILENSGVAFRTVRKFVEAVKESLIMSLLENCVSPLEQIFSLSLSIFVTLIRQFKPHLKTELGVFLDNIFLRIAENPNSTFGHKMMILQVFSKLAQDPQTIVDIFLNYDCDEKAVPIFQHLVSLLEKFTQGRFVSENWISPQQEATLKMLGLESMVSVIKSLVAWSEKALQLDDQGKNVSESAHAPVVSVETDSISSTLLVAHAAASEDQHLSGPESVVSPPRQTLQDNFERLRQKRSIIEKAVLKFNSKPKSGIKFLIDNGVFQESPEAIANFLHSNVGLDKTEMGDYIGEGDAWNIKILHAYVDYMDFTGLTFENALRYFLEGFRLPGEAQKIDRIMEKFAEKFCRCNPNVFASADVAYVLAYAVIMLNTDAHSSQVKNKMTKEQFLKNNRGINGDKDLDPEYLGGIYDRIKSNEIKMNDARAENGSVSVDPKLRHVSFRRESQALVKKTQQLMQQGSSQNGGGPISGEGFFFASPDDASAIKPMFQVLWGPAHATFSVLLQDLEDPRLIALCLDGYRFAIRLAGLFQLHTEQEAFVQSLAQFTLLGTAKEMKQKNIDAIKILLTIAFTEGNRLTTCWGTVLKCISEFERLHLIGSGARSDSMFFSENQRQNRDSSSDAVRQDQQTGNAQNVVGQIEPSLLDRIFTHSARLSSEAIVYFVDNICQVSAREMAHPSEPRVFSLQKIVEITYYNMGRVRYVWSRMWRVLSEHFAYAGSHENPRISMYAIDSLRQLAAKFLDKEELSNYQFQKVFLKPFEVIMARNPSSEIREFILQCFSRMIFTKISNIKSGWISVFTICKIAARDKHESVVSSAFELIERILRENFNLVVDAMPELVDALVSFGLCPFLDFALQSISHLTRCSQWLGSLSDEKALKSNVTDEIQAECSENSASFVISDSSADLNVWLCILRGLAQLVGDRRFEVRSRALHLLFKILKMHGCLFSPSVWQIIFRGVLIPIFEDTLRDDSDNSKLGNFQVTPDFLLLNGAEASKGSERSNKAPAVGSAGSGSTGSAHRKSDAAEQQDHAWIRTTCLSAMSSLIDLFAHFYGVVNFLLPDVISLLSSCILQNFDELAKIGVKSLALLMQSVGPLFDSNAWDMILTGLDALVSETLPVEICSEETRQKISAPSATPTLPFQLRPVVTKCTVQILLLESVAEMFHTHWKSLGEKHILMLTSCLSKSKNFAQSFNQDLALRRSLLSAGFREHQRSIPDLFFQEARSSAIQIGILMKLFQSDSHPLFNSSLFAESRLLPMIQSYMSEFVAKDRTNRSQENYHLLEDELRCQENVIVLILQGVQDWSESQFKSHLQSMMPLCFDFVECDSLPVRMALKAVLFRLPRLLPQ